MSGDSWANVRVSGVILEVLVANAVDPDIPIGRTRMKRRDGNDYT